MLPVRVFQNCVNDVCSSPLSTWSRLPRLVDEMLDSSLWQTAAGALPVDIRQEGDSWIIEAEMPGLNKDDVNITAENGVLTISGKYATEGKNENAQYHLRERRTGEFSRSFRLPKTADTENVAANLAGKEADLVEPLVIKDGSDIGMICDSIHRDFRKNFRYAQIWGKSARSPGQMVGLNHKVRDQDIVTIIVKR